jgi:hypothetical protein
MRLRLAQLVKFLRANDVQITLSKNGMAYDAPQGVITADIAAEMKRHKADLISYLKLKPFLNEAQMRNKLILGDSEIVLSDIPDNSIDCIVTDPPYGYGFMGNGWDHSVPRTDIWNECLRVLKPGAFAFIMSAPRQDVLGRQIFCIEEAGFCVDFTPIYWAYASGFPKAHSISKAVDRKAGAARKILGRNPNSRENCDISNTIYESGTVGKTAYMTEPATEEAKIFEGAYAGFQPKPAVEVIIVAMKPLSEKTFGDQAKANGKGITWLDDCRVPCADTCDQLIARACTTEPNRHRPFTSIANKYRSREYAKKNENARGRFPANLLVSDDVINIESKGALAPVKSGQKGFGGQIYGKYKSAGDDGASFYSDKETSTSYSRFFSLDTWAEKNLPFLMVPKASKREKDAGIEGEVREIDTRTDRAKGSMVEKGLPPGKNIHPTVKPLKLMTYLVTMGSRPGDIVLDPFSGTGTTSIASMMLKRDYVGIEISPEYHEIALKRLEYFRRKKAA